MNNIEKLAIEHGSTCYTGQEYHFERWQLEAFAQAYARATLQTKPVADYTPNKDCTICNGGGLYCVGYSGSESDGNAPILERCECYLDNTLPPSTVPVEKYNKLLDALKDACLSLPLGLSKNLASQAIAEAEANHEYTNDA